MVVDRESLDRDGYVVIRNAVPIDNARAVVNALAEYTGRYSDDVEHWCKEAVGEGAMVNMSENQAIWDNRQAPVVHQAFAEVCGTERLWAILDRVSINPPANDEWQHDGFLHWDIDPNYAPDPLFHGILYLTDTTAEMGGFQCVPGSHRRLIDWQATHVPNEDTMMSPMGDCCDWMMKAQHPIKQWVMTDQKPRSVPGKAGDLLIWNAALLHGNGKNISDEFRFAQYVSMTPEGTVRTKKLVSGGEDLRQARIDTWRFGFYPRIVAEALGVPEGVIDYWIRKILEHPFVERERSVEVAKQVPRPYFKARLSESQLRAFADLLLARRFWEDDDIRQSKRMGGKWGISGYFLKVELSCKRLVELMETQFGLTFSAAPAHLTELGEKLLGLQSWEPAESEIRGIEATIALSR